MSITEFGYCPNCEDRKEFVPNQQGNLICHSCGTPNIYESRKAYEEQH